MNIKDYLHLYLGCYWSNGKHSVLLSPHNMYDGTYSDFKLVLRPLSDMTDGERRDYLDIKQPYSGFDVLHANGSHDYTEWINGFKFQFLLYRRFDLFGLIEAGLAIDKTKVVS